MAATEKRNAQHIKIATLEGNTLGVGNIVLAAMGRLYGRSFSALLSSVCEV